MTLYLDSSAIIKLYKAEADSDECQAIIGADGELVSARHTFVEVISVIDRDDAGHNEQAIREFRELWNDVRIVEIDSLTCEIATGLARETGARTLDAMHLAAMWRAGGSSLTMLTYDKKLAAATRHLGMPVASVA